MSSRQKLIPYNHITQNSKGEMITELWKQFFVDIRSNSIYFEAKINGKRIKFSTKEKVPNGVKAKRYANAELDRRLGRKKTIVRTLIKEELKSYKKIKETEGHKYDTMNNVNRAIDEIEEFWGNMLPSQITEDTVTEWLEWWQKNKTIQMENVIKYMRNFCKYLARKVVNGYPLLPAVPKITDPNRKKNKAARQKKKENIFTSENFKKIYAAATCLDEQVLCLIMYTMASRVTETLSMSFDSEIYLDQEPPIYRWRMGQNKADLEGFHSLHPSLLGPLRALKDLRDSQGTKRLFPQKLNIHAPLKAQQIDWAEWEKRADIGWHWTPHTFKHTCLSNLFNNPNNPQLLICKLYRISYQEAERTYVKPTEEGRFKMRDSIVVEL